MAKDKKRARQIAQAQKQRQQQKAAASPAPQPRPSASPSPSPVATAEAKALGRSPISRRPLAGIGGASADSEAVRRSVPKVNLERKVTVRLDADRFDELETYARSQGFTVSVIVRHLLCRFLEDQRRLL
jgi:hypothetical protein